MRIEEKQIAREVKGSCVDRFTQYEIDSYELTVEREYPSEEIDLKCVINPETGKYDKIVIRLSK